MNYYFPSHEHHIDAYVTIDGITASVRMWAKAAQHATPEQAKKIDAALAAAAKHPAAPKS